MDSLHYYMFGEGNESCACLTYTLYFVTLIGFLKFSKGLLTLVSFIYRHSLKGFPNFMSKYGDKDSWVVVTGGSDGIGEQICKDLSLFGFNICIIGRNEQKMKEKLDLIRKHSGKEIKTRYIVSDLAQNTQISQYEQIAQQLKDIDIAMLFLNAGINEVGPFLDFSPELIEQVININALHPAYLLKVLLNQQLQRKKRSAIVITSSELGSFPAPGAAIYGASKAFSEFLGLGLNYEVSDKIDVMSFICGQTVTKQFHMKPNARSIEVEQCVRGCLRDIGSMASTYGHFIHDVNSYFSKPLQNMMQKKVFEHAVETQNKRDVLPNKGKKSQ